MTWMHALARRSTVLSSRDRTPLPIGEPPLVIHPSACKPLRSFLFLLVNALAACRAHPSAAATAIAAMLLRTG